MKRYVDRREIEILVSALSSFLFYYIHEKFISLHPDPSFFLIDASSLATCYNFV